MAEAFKLPSRAEAGYLDPEIAGEGKKVLLSDGEEVAWTPPPEQLCMPDLSKVKSLRKYFGRSGHQPYPAWVYHPVEAPRVVKNHEEAMELGVYYRQTSEEERSKYGRSALWDWDETSQWRPTPYPKDMKFDPKKAGQGKNYMPAAPDPFSAQNHVIASLVPQVAAAVAEVLRQQGGAVAPAGVNPAELDEFRAFMAWKRSQTAVEEAVEEASQANALNTHLSADEEYTIWRQEAEERGIKVDGRWSLDRLKSEVEKAAQA